MWPEPGRFVLSLVFLLHKLAIHISTFLLCLCAAGVCHEWSGFSRELVNSTVVAFDYAMELDALGCEMMDD